MLADTPRRADAPLPNGPVLLIGFDAYLADDVVRFTLWDDASPRRSSNVAMPARDVIERLRPASIEQDAPR